MGGMILKSVEARREIPCDDSSSSRNDHSLLSSDVA